MKTPGIIFLFAGILTPGFLQAQKDDLRLTYDQPARHWEETLPLGNGRLGMMPDGGIEKETIVLNEVSLWSGSAQDANRYEASKSLPEIRSLLREGRNDEAEVLINKNFVCAGEGSGRGSGATVPFGCYQVLGELELIFNYRSAEPKPTNYHRELSLGDAVARCSFDLDRNHYTREYFTSFGHDISVVKLTSKNKAQLNMAVRLKRPERFKTVVQNGQLVMTGQLTNGTDGKGMRYAAVVGVTLKGGKLVQDSDQLKIEGADEVVLRLSSGTDFRDNAVKEHALANLTDAMKTPYASEVNMHEQAYKKWFDRVDLTLGDSQQSMLPTDQRLEQFYAHPEKDAAMATLFFQFGRYLSISSTRVGLLPPNLQGLWANQVQTPWNGDYHLDVNVQMNHWPLEVTNLSELNLPLRDLVKGMVKPGERTAKAYYNSDGWVAHVITNIWGFTEPGEDASWGSTNSGSGWLCNNLWDHYTFTLDREYLASIYPILKGSAQFYSSSLIQEPEHGWLVTAPSVSPENTFYLPNGKTASVCMGPTIDNQIIRELFANVVTASEVLKTDTAFREKLKTLLTQLPPAGRVASDGRLMEWLKEYKETEPRHRHVSHLYGLYPASLISPDKTPELAEACRKTLNVRGDDSPGWSKAYKILFWARLHDGDRAFSLFHELLKPTGDTRINYGGGGGSYLNLLSAGPPFQIDGNFGGTAGIAEMLIQSHDGCIELLPALPEAWKATGAVKGLRARGDYTVDFQWKNGIVTSYAVYAGHGKSARVKINGKVEEIIPQKK